MHERQRNLVSILERHSELVVSDTALDESLAQLARGAAELAGCPHHLALIRVQDPHSLIHMQDAWATRSFDPFAETFATSIAHAIRAQKPREILHLPLRFETHSGSILIVPLLGNDACYGYLCLGSDNPNHFARLRLPWLKAIAGQAVQTIHIESLRYRASLITVAEAGTLTHERLLLDLQSSAVAAVERLGVKHAVVEILGLTAEREALVTLAVAVASAEGKHSEEASRQVLPGYFAARETPAWRAAMTGRLAEYSHNREHDQAGMESGGSSKQLTSVGSTLTGVALPLIDTYGAVLGVMNVESPGLRTLKTAPAQLEPLRIRAEATLRRTDDSVRAAATSFRAVMGRLGAQIPSLLAPRKLRVLYQAILRRSVQLIGLPNLKAAIAFCGEGVFTITPDATYGYPRELREIWSWPEDKGLTGKARAERQPVRVPDVHAPELEDVYFEQDPLAVSEMDIPLMLGERVIGVLDFISPDRDAFTAKHQESVEAFARQVVQTLERARVISTLWQQVEELQLIRSTSEGIESMLRVQVTAEQQGMHDTGRLRKEREDLLKKLLKNAVDYTRSDYGAILAAVRLPLEYDSTSEMETVEFVEMTSQGLDGIPHTMHFPLATSRSVVAVKAFESKRHQAFSDVRREVGEESVLFGPDVKSCLAVPIPGGNQVMGVLCLESRDRRMYSPPQIKRVANLAAQAANVISAANLYLYHLKMSSLLKLVDEVMTKSLARAEDIIHAEIRDNILKIALDLTEQQDDGYASLWLMRNSRLHFEVSVPTIVTRKKPQPGIVRLALERERPIVVPDVAEPPYKDRFLQLYQETQSELAVPLLDPDKKPGELGRVLGVLNIESPRKAAFSERDVEIIDFLARIMVTSMRLTEMHRDRIEYLADVSHGLPHLSLPVGSFVRRLRQLGAVPQDTGPKSVEIQTIFHQLDQSVQTLSTFIECSYTLARHERLGAPITMEATSLLTLAQDMVDALEFRASAKQRTIELWSKSQDITVWCASHLLKVAIFALIENAIEHGSRDDTISVRVRKLPGYGGRIEVIDHGDPVPPEERQRLFSRRYGQRPTPPGSGVLDRGNSSGIGLDHVRRIVHDVHGGQADYRRDKRGKVFYLDLPLEGGRQDITAPTSRMSQR